MAASQVSAECFNANQLATLDSIQSLSSILSNSGQLPDNYFDYFDSHSAQDLPCDQSFLQGITPDQIFGMGSMATRINGGKTGHPYNYFGLNQKKRGGGSGDIDVPPLNFWSKIDSDRVTALIEVQITPERGRGFDAIAEKIYLHTEVKSVYLMSGAYDLLVEIEGSNLKEVASFVSNKLSPIESVLSTKTFFILKKYKQDGFIFEDTEGDQRMSVSP
jgi:DNA-binding Lrp family transcriptional regulator